MSPAASTGMSGQITISAMLAAPITKKAIAAASNTKERTVNPIHRLTRLSPNARRRASNPAPGYVMIRRHGEKSVRSNMVVENMLAKLPSRRCELHSTPIQPVLYHQLKMLNISILMLSVASKGLADKRHPMCTCTVENLLGYGGRTSSCIVPGL